MTRFATALVWDLYFLDHLGLPQMQQSKDGRWGIPYHIFSTKEDAEKFVSDTSHPLYPHHILQQRVWSYDFLHGPGIIDHRKLGKGT